MHGWLPLTIQAIAAVIVVAAIGWRTRTWRRVWLPAAVAVGALLAASAYWYIAAEGLADDPAPNVLWIWIAVVGISVVVLAAGWRGARWWRRGAAIAAVPLSLLCAALALNLWVGYFPTVQNAWNQLTAGPLPDQTDQGTVVAMQKARRIPAAGTVVPVDIGSAASGFKHRGELVYLPPAWYASDPPPPLPTVMMIGGEFNTPADWLRAGNAIKTIDDFAAAHGGNAPVLVFVDSGGAFNNDTECVNGARGNAADHLTKDVPPFMEATYGVSTDPAKWGIVGWSMGGTCAVDLAVMHPDLFSTIEDIAGDIAPNSGNQQQTIDRLFSGDKAEYASFDPMTVIAKHGRYTGVSAWFDVNGTPSVVTPPVVNAGNSGGSGLGGRDAAAHTSDQASAANTLCATGAANGIACEVVTQPGKHDWPFAAHAFASALPWMASTLGTPGVPAVALPAPAPPPPTVQAAAK
ncbi:alpha/beta hydrolase [Mycolicibacterium arenosum]|uniref:Alpha/beta hydrolase-fold protein n=1 Tax=Mycolicibacterium arenosum TaxID=2952157 RepID=A0ABT1M2T2_9MYCO|nr:alpha/beta hydrolase-fold protein [Mycolicibacterium sp. CAU 1645]MCP9272564.1 alpha/beta hydrolase-fold protein [Mycolicibacterium sp. CAU 1645]